MIIIFKKKITKDIFLHWFMTLDSQPDLSWVPLDTEEQFSESLEAEVCCLN